MAFWAGWECLAVPLLVVLQAQLQLLFGVLTLRTLAEAAHMFTVKMLQAKQLWKDAQMQSGLMPGCSQLMGVQELSSLSEGSRPRVWEHFPDLQTGDLFTS